MADRPISSHGSARRQVVVGAPDAAPGRGRLQIASGGGDAGPTGAHGQRNARTVPAKGDQIRHFRRAAGLAETVSAGIELHTVSWQIKLELLSQEMAACIDAHHFAEHHPIAPMKVG